MLDAPVVDDVLAPLLLGATHAPRAPGVFAIAAPRGFLSQNGASMQPFPSCKGFVVASKTSHQKPHSPWKIRGNFSRFHVSPSPASADFIDSPLPRQERKQRL